MKITLTQFRPNTAEAVWTDCFAQAIAELHKAGGGVLTVPTGEYSTGPIELCSNIEFFPGVLFYKYSFEGVGMIQNLLFHTLFYIFW